ncbi:Plasma membrane proteolipid 3 [Choanephora cucurbitarum]|uniref:Plasma membrane proteolipid 3 n=1 Tax=Choanephora cucurbitarum TaxID=101091 RepID=A0A1C7N0V7_9FUNG|nr:Plasma membrane proteolipid 3 [Choanephora cucurbitarum]
MAFTCSDICKILFVSDENLIVVNEAIILPPLGVLLERGCVCDFWINIALTVLGYIPGIIHALYIILKY